MRQRWEPEDAGERQGSEEGGYLPLGTKDCRCVEKRQMWLMGKWQFLKGSQEPLCWDELANMLITGAKRGLLTAGIQYLDSQIKEEILAASFRKVI